MGAMDKDQSLGALYLSIILIFAVTALAGRLRLRKGGATAFTATDGERSFDGVYWVDDGIVYVSCPVGRRGRPPGPNGVLRTAQDLLIDIHRDAGLIERPAP
jgi:hypothetical protein